MGKIAIVTDSAACLPTELVQEYGIHIVPFGLIFGEQVFRDGVDITPNQFYHLLAEASDLPTTSQPSVGDFLRVYESLSREVEAIVSIHIPKELSGTLSTAREAARLVPQVPIRIVDSRTAVTAQGFVVLEAARMAAAGGDLDRVVARAEEMIPRVHLFAVLETLEYLHRGGRVPAVAALLGSALQIRPIFSLRDGRVDVLARVRTKTRAVERMLTMMAEKAEDRPVHAAVFHADVPEEAEALRDRVASRFNCMELYVTEFTPVMGAHTGPGVLGLALWSEEG
ncbi:MAG: DegV family protein [Anaerolineae bacterium]